jgi:hypothetical protein
MDPMARLNYAKIYTVEHNVKVYDFGIVHEDYLDTFKHQFNSSFSGDQMNDEDEDEDD